MIKECQLTPNAIQVLESRYLLKNDKDEIIETPEQMWRRIADNIADNKKLADKIYKLMCETKFLPNSPAFNAGTKIKNYSACFALPLHDSMESIFQTLKTAALIFQSGGGVGVDFSEIRPVGSPVKSTQGVASGVISFATVYNAAIETIKQGGKRRGAAIGLLPISHPEVIEWIHAKDEGKTLSNFNLSVIITKEFMEAVKNNAMWELKFKEKIYKTISAKELFEMICKHAWKTGDPGIVFIDNINKYNCHKHIGLVHNTNPCWTGDTRIWTIYGEKRFDELIGKNIPVLTLNDNNKLCFKMMRDIKKTQSNANIIEITIKSGQLGKSKNIITILKCTPDHKLFLRNGEIKEAKDLKLNDRLDSVYRGKANQKGRIGLSTTKKESIQEHLVVVEWKYGRKPNYPEEHCHHIDNNCANNHPDNLQILPASQHNSEAMLMDKNPMYKIWDERNPLFGKPVDGKNNPRYRKDIDDNEIIKMRDQEHMKWTEIGRKYNMCSGAIKKRYITASKINHIVLSIKKLDIKEDVYNGVVDDVHRFFVMCGKNDAILSKNCGEINIYTGISPFAFPELKIEVGEDIAESCNLGSFDISKYIDNSKMNWTALANDIPFAIRFLDCIPDKNEYAVPIIEKGTKLLRKIGLGLMGFADALAKLGISYESKEAIEFGEQLMEFINYHSTKASMELAKEKGVFPAYKGSAWDTGEVWNFKNMTDRFDWKELKSDIAKNGMRNCNVNAIAPTGTLSILAGCSSSIEPIFGIVYEKHIALGVLYESNPIFKELMIKRGIYTKEIEAKCSKHASIQDIKDIPDDIKKLFLTSHDVSYQQHIAIQVAFQKYTDLNISKTINCLNSAKVEDVINAYTLAAEFCKGITIYRDGSKDEQVLVGGNLKDAPTPRQRYQDHVGIVREVQTGCGAYYNIIDFDLFGLFEDFQVNSGKGGCDGSQKASGRMISTGLRNNINPEVYIKQLHRVHCESCTTKRNGGIEYECESCGEKFTTKKKAKQCPMCESPNLLQKDTKRGIKVLSCADGVSQHMGDYVHSPEIIKEILKLQKLIHNKFNNSKDSITLDNLSSDVYESKKLNEGRNKCPECGSESFELNSRCFTCYSCGYTKCS